MTVYKNDTQTEKVNGQNAEAESILATLAAAAAARRRWRRRGRTHKYEVKTWQKRNQCRSRRGGNLRGGGRAAGAVAGAGEVAASTWR